MWPDRVSNPRPLTYKSGVLPTALRGLATLHLFALVQNVKNNCRFSIFWAETLFCSILLRLKPFTITVGIYPGYPGKGP